MRHKVKGRKLGRDTKARKALFKSLITSLILYESIETTEAKAKAVKGLMDKLMTKAKTGTLQARRMLGAFLLDSKAIEKVMDVLVPRFEKRKSGYTRIIRVARRRGDGAQMVKIEFVKEEKKEVKTEEKQGKKETVKKSSKGRFHPKDGEPLAQSSGQKKTEERKKKAQKKTVTKEEKKKKEPKKKGDK